MAEFLFITKPPKDDEKDPQVIRRSRIRRYIITPLLSLLVVLLSLGFAAIVMINNKSDPGYSIGCRRDSSSDWECALEKDYYYHPKETVFFSNVKEINVLETLGGSNGIDYVKVEIIAISPAKYTFEYIFNSTSEHSNLIAAKKVNVFIADKDKKEFYHKFNDKSLASFLIPVFIALVFVVLPLICFIFDKFWFRKEINYEK